MSKVVTKGSFPSQAVSDFEKSEIKYGMQVAKAIESEWFKKDSGSTRYFANRDQFHRLRLYARGEQSIQKYKNELSINGDLSYLNLDWKPVPIIPKFVDIVVNGIQERTYSLKAFSVDPTASKKRTRFVQEMLNDMYAKDYAAKLEQAVGVKTLSNDPDNIPEDEEELNLYMQLNYKQSIEIAQEQALENVFALNKYDLLKKRLDYDITVLGIGCLKNSFNTAEGIKLEYVDPADLVYSYTESPYFDDIYYVGEIRKVSIVELKKQFPQLSNQDIEDIQNKGGSKISRKAYSDSLDIDPNYVQVLYF